jgi:nicotinamidase-related amidase
MHKAARFVRPRRPSFDRILVDMNTQCDLLLPQGAVPVINRFEVLANTRRIMNWVRTESLPVISSMECRRIGEFSRGLPPYCVDRSSGQCKVPITLLPRRLIVHNDITHDIPPNPFLSFQQVILVKRSHDFLQNPKVDRLFQNISANHLVFFGAVAERCVKSAVMSLIARRQSVGVVTDACGAWSAAAADMAMRQMDAKGAVLLTTDELISGAADDRLRSALPAFVPEEKEAAAVGPQHRFEAFCWP